MSKLIFFQVLILDNGRYATRLAEICRTLGINVKVIPMNLKTLQEFLANGSADIGGVVCVHCETSTGIVNPIDDVGDIVKRLSPGMLL